MNFDICWLNVAPLFLRLFDLTKGAIFIYPEIQKALKSLYLLNVILGGSGDWFYLFIYSKQFLDHGDL